MERERVAAELPPSMREWIADADARIWERIAREIAARVVARLMSGAWPGEAGWNRALHDALLRDPSPAVRAMAADLGTGRASRAWSRGAVAVAACEFLGLHGAGAWRDVRDLAGRKAARIRRSAA